MYYMSTWTLAGRQLGVVRLVRLATRVDKAIERDALRIDTLQNNIRSTSKAKSWGSKTLLFKVFSRSPGIGDLWASGCPG